MRQVIDLNSEWLHW